MWHDYLGVKVTSLLHKGADCKPEAVGQSKIVDCSGHWDVVVARIQGADMTALMIARPPPSGAKSNDQLHGGFSIAYFKIFSI